MSLIHLKDVNKTYQGAQPLHVLKGIDLDIERGEFVSIMGASGSGKSTLLNILGILDNYDTGEYRLNDVLIKDLSETRAAEYRNKMIGFIFQSFNLISFKTAVENVELPLFYQGVSRKKRHELAMDYLDKLGLKQWANHYPNEMSGGQKQRVAIARALITLNDKDIRIIALGVDGLYGGVGNEGIGIIARFIILVDSHHLEVEVADLYVLAHQRTVVFAEFLGLASAQHHILALLLHIDFVDESSGNQLRLVDFGMRRSHTHQRLACHIIITIVDVHVILFQSSAHIIHVLAVGLVADEDILVVERDASAFLQSLVSLGGFAREYSHGVG
jgi:ABC-type lipoprotein export system ATPase subunit